MTSIKTKSSKKKPILIDLDSEVVEILEEIREDLGLDTIAQALGHAVGTESFLWNKLKRRTTQLILRYKDNKQEEVILFNKRGFLSQILASLKYNVPKINKDNKEKNTMSESQTEDNNSLEIILDSEVVEILEEIRKGLNLDSLAQALGHAIGTEQFLWEKLKKDKTPGKKRPQLILRYPDKRLEEVIIFPD